MSHRGFQDKRTSLYSTMGSNRGTNSEPADDEGSFYSEEESYYEEEQYSVDSKGQPIEYVDQQEEDGSYTEEEGSYSQEGGSQEESYYEDDQEENNEEGSYYSEEYSQEQEGSYYSDERSRSDGGSYEESYESRSQQASYDEEEGEGSYSQESRSKFSYESRSQEASYDEEGEGSYSQESRSKYSQSENPESYTEGSGSDSRQDNGYGYSGQFAASQAPSQLSSTTDEMPSFAIDSDHDAFGSSTNHSNGMRYSKHSQASTKSFAEESDFSDAKDEDQPETLLEYEDESSSASEDSGIEEEEVPEDAFEPFGDDAIIEDGDDSLQFEELLRDPLGLEERSKSSRAASVAKSKASAHSRSRHSQREDDRSNAEQQSLAESFISAKEKVLMKITEHSADIDSRDPSSSRDGSSFAESQTPRGTMGGNNSRISTDSFTLGESRETFTPGIHTPDTRFVLRSTSVNGYTREQMANLRKTVNLDGADDDSMGSSIVSSRTNGTSKSVRRKRKKRLKMLSKKSEGLLQLNYDVSSIMEEIGDFDEEGLDESSPLRLILGFESLVSILLYYSDELELLNAFKRKKDDVAKLALQNLINFATPLDDLLLNLKPAILHFVDNEIDEELNDCLFGMNQTIEQICVIAQRIGEKREWGGRAQASFVTLVELLCRDGFEVEHIFRDEDTPEYLISEDIENAWVHIGLAEELGALQETQDLELFRQLCYEVILNTDQWCPDLQALQDICGVTQDLIEIGEEPDPNDDILAPTPETAIQVLEKIDRDPIPRTTAFMSVLRRVIPSYAVTDLRVAEEFASIRSSVLDELGLPQATMIAITSVAENVNDPESKLGLAGVGKTTLAAMIADDEDVRRHYKDGVAWLHVGREELTYSRYVDCLLDIIAQLNLEDEEEPFFPELLHIPGESPTKRKRREEGFMLHAQDMMADYVLGLKILIILDDVYYETDLEWFDFGLPEEEEEDLETFCMLLITTRNRSILPAIDKVEVDVLEEYEAAELLRHESGALAEYLAVDSAEVHDMVTECAFHPLAIKSVGRWLSLKHTFAGAVSSVSVQEDIVKSVNKLLRGNQENADLMYEILNMSLTPTVNEKPAVVVKLCFAAFVRVFCQRQFVSDSALFDPLPSIPFGMAVCLFENLLELEEQSLQEEFFHSQKTDTAQVIIEALTVLGILKPFITSSEDLEGPEEKKDDMIPREQKFLQVTHAIQYDYAEHVLTDDPLLKDFTKNAEVKWNRAFAQGYYREDISWDTEDPDESLDYALEMLPIHMIRGEMFAEAANLLANESFTNGRLFAYGRDVATRRHIQDCEALFEAFVEDRVNGRKRTDAKLFIQKAYKTIGELLPMGQDEYLKEEGSQEAIEVARSHYQLGFSLAENRCWEAALEHWDISQELFSSVLGIKEIIAAILFSSGVVYCEMSEYEKALESLKQCLRIRLAIHGEEHILYAQTIQKVGDVFLAMSDYQEAIESYEWALDVMHIEPRNHRIDIGDILERMSSILYSKGEIEKSLLFCQDALKSKKVDLGENHPELASAYQHIGNCLSDLGKVDEAVAHLREAIRLKQLDKFGGAVRDAEILTIEGVLNNLRGKPKKGLECYEKALQIIVTKAPHRKQQVASLLYMIGCVYLMGGEHKKALKLFQESLHARRKVLGFVHLDVASTLFNMAFLYQTRNRLDKALKCLEEALKIRELRLPDSEKVAITQEKIGTFAKSIGKLKKAENAFQDALRIRRKLYGNDHESVATVLQELGDLMDEIGEYDSAMKFYVEALDIRQEQLGDDPLVANTLYRMGYALQNKNAYEKSLRCFEECLDILSNFSEDSKEVGDALNMIGYVHGRIGDFDEAKNNLWEALSIRKNHGDKDRIFDTLKNIGNVHREEGEYDLALECFEECLRLRRNELDEDDDKIAEVLIAIGHVFTDLENGDEALQAFSEALNVRIRLFGVTDNKVATVLQYMGFIEFRAQAYEQALSHFLEFVDIRQANDFKKDETYVNVLFTVGNIHNLQGNEDDAKKCWKEAYKIFKELGMAEQNPQIADVMRSLVPDADDEEEDAENQWKRTKNMLSRFTEKMKDAVGEQKLGLSRKKKNRGHQL